MTKDKSSSIPSSSKDNLSAKLEVASGGSKVSTAAGKGGTKFVVRATNILALRAGADGYSVDNTKDVTNVERIVDASNTKDALTELDKLSRDHIPAGCAAYTIFVQEVAENSEPRTWKKEGASNISAAIEGAKADLQKEEEQKKKKSK